MTSNVEDVSNPDISSIDQNEDMSEVCRMERDSSNDADMFEDSSGRESEATCGLSDVPTISNSSKNSKSLKRPALDEECLMPMSEEELDFFEKYRDANQAQLESLKCTTCSCQLFLQNRDNIRIHPVLGVLVCKSCREFYSNGPFTKDQNGHDEYCRWCAEGGMIICCDTCSNVFCKACLRRCIGRASLLAITSSNCNWSCLVCNNNPLWAHRALCRMAVNALKAPSRRSIGRSLLSSPATADATDPAIWLPSIISEAEKLATYCKVLATKIGNNWSKDCADSGGEGSSSGRRDKESDKLKVINCCRKLRKTVTTTRLNMELLEKRMVTKYEQKYGNAADIDVDVHSKASNSKQGSSPRFGKRLIVKFKKFREGNNEEDFYAEVRESPSPSLTSQPARSLPVKSSGSISSMATIPQKCSPLPTNELFSDIEDDVPTQPIVPTVDDSPTNDDGEQFFDTCSDVVENKQTDDSCSLGFFPKRSESNTRLSNQLKNTRDSDDSDPEASPRILPLYLSVTDDEVTNSQKTVKKEAESNTPSPLIGVSDVTVSPRRNSVEHATKTPVEVKSEKKPFKSKLSRTNTPNSKQHLNQVPSSASKDEVTAKSSLKTTILDGDSDSKYFAPKARSNLDANERARRALLKDSSDSDDSLGEIELSPRVKRTQKRIREPLLGMDDPKLKAACSVVVNRLDVNKTIAFENGKALETKESTLAKEINRLVKNPVKITKRDKTIISESEEEDDDKIMSRPKPKPKKAEASKTIYSSSSSSSSSDSDNESAPDAVNRVLDSESPLDPNVIARQRLLASSDSEADIEMDMSENVYTQDEIVEEEHELGTGDADIIEDPETEADANAVDEAKVEINSDEDGESVGVKSSNLKANRLLRISLADPEADSDSKSQKGKELKGDKKKKPKERKKRRIQSDSDFESSASEKEKKKRKKKRSSPSDVEEISDDDDSENEAKRKSKPRRRIKKTAGSDSEDSDSDVQVLNDSQRSDAGNKGRKNIKKIMKDTSLKDETRKAAKEEEDRKRRIAERQKFYNEAFVGDMALINKMTDHLVLDFDPETKEELVTVDKQIVTKLKPHQVKGVKFMWDACFESIERLKEHPGSGCILAHCMGLGKSLQVVTLVHTVLTHKACQVDRVLVVCPLSTVLNWVNEFKVWLPKDADVDVYELASVKGNQRDQRMYTLRNWLEGGGVMIIGYDMYRNLANEQNKKVKPKARDIFQRSLVDPGPQLVICDEGHLLKNEATAISKAMNKIATRRRIVLTGTPLQNSLIEYHCMIQFVKPNLLGTKKEFTNRFANPIKNGQAADSTEGDVRVMKRRAHVLHKMLEDSVQRFDYAVLTPFLPPKHEYVVSVKMSELQIKMYQYYLEHHAKGGPGHIGRGKGAGLFADFQELGRVWTHPKALLLAELSRESKAKSHSDSEGSLVDFIDDREDSPLTEEDGGVVCLDESGSENEGAAKSNGFRMRTRAARGDQPPPEDELGVTAPMSGSWWSQFISEEDYVKIEHSGKLVLLMDILRQCELIGDKVLVFSQSLVSLNLIEAFLAAEDQQNEQNRQTASLASDIKNEKTESIGMWRLNMDYFRLDGQTSPELRKNWCNSFNNPNNLRSRLFLISTKAGGLGINLVAANRVIIFDASWNPSHDVQSIFRVYRFGQKKPCYIYRFLAQGTMEEKIYDRQVTKLSLSCRVVDEQQIERHFNSADLNELYVFEPDSHLRRPTPLLPKDRLLAELTIQRKDWIVTYHEHDSLLENKSDEELTEAERKAAWDDFENEKRGVNPMMMPESTGYVNMPGMPDILGGLVGRSVAGIPLSSIAAMIYNSNPGITQDEFLGRLRLTVDQLQNFSVQQAAVAAAAAASAQSSLQQPGDAQRLLMQRQVAADQLKRQFGNAPPPAGLPGPSGVGVAQPRSRGRPTIGPHQRTDLYGPPVLFNSTTASNQPTESGSSSVPKP